MTSGVDKSNLVPPPPPPPVAYAQAVPAGVPFDKAGACRSFLAEHGWPQGLIETMVGQLSSVAYRFFILDDSGSMSDPKTSSPLAKSVTSVIPTLGPKWRRLVIH